MSNEIRIVGAVVILLISFGCSLLIQNTNATREANVIAEERKEIDLRQEYERVVLGCNTAGALETNDPWLRELCDDTLPEIRREIIGLD